MLKRLAPYLAVVYLTALLAFLRYRTGIDWRVQAIVIMSLLFVVISAAVYWYEQRLRRDLAELDPAVVAELRRTDAELDEVISDLPRSNERVDWAWRASDVGGGIALMFYPPLIYTIWRYRELTPTTPFDGFAVLAMLAGTASYIFWRRHRLRSYRCPSCREEPKRLRGKTIRFGCAKCGTAWRLGRPLIGDG